MKPKNVNIGRIRVKTSGMSAEQARAFGAQIAQQLGRLDLSSTGGNSRTQFAASVDAGNDSAHQVALAVSAAVKGNDD